MKNTLTNKKAVITGGASGIGLATAKKLASEGAHVALIDLNLDYLEKARKEIGKDVLVYQCDITKKGELESLAKQILSKWEDVDILVNCAGISRYQEQGIINEDVFDTLIDVNLKGTYLCAMIFGYTCMKDKGSIVNISSVRGRTGTPSFSSGYAAAKAGIINLTKSLALELAEKGIRVNCVAPGAVYPTGLSQSWSKDLRNEISESIPMKRLGKPEEIADSIYFLVSDLSTYITGQTIDVNGGQWMN